MVAECKNVSEQTQMRCIWPFLANVNSCSRSLFAVARPSVCRL